MAIIESQNYIDALKRSKSKEIKVASYDRKEFIKKQGNKCSKCKRDLRAGYYKISVDPKTKEKSAICSDCLVSIPERR
ncbi:hypothetical protein J4411_00735 [Candidatus Pacearchaeota archaeon]|nr:hypothetical protein [uncultured archaeon]MBS3084422.1 hypothetical protein [Candidatus Pacearchaeota archaeon]